KSLSRTEPGLLRRLFRGRLARLTHAREQLGRRRRRVARLLALALVPRVAVRAGPLPLGRRRVGCHGLGSLAHRGANVKRPQPAEQVLESANPGGGMPPAPSTRTMSFDPLLGTQVGPYRLLGLLGVGGMSRV